MIEQRYRRVLRLLPIAYRRVWEEDMVDAFLESTRTGDAEVDDYQRDYGWPSLSETGSVVALAVRLRIGGVGAPARSFAWGEALRLAVLVVLLVQAAYAIVTSAFGIWSSGRVHWLPQPPPDLAMPDGPLAAVLIPLAFNAVTVAIFLLLVRGHHRKALLAAVAVALASAPFHSLSVGGILFLVSQVVLVGAMAAAFRADTPLPSRRWLLALLGAVALTALPATVFMLAGTGTAVTSDDLFAMLLIAGMIVALVRPATSPSRLLALAMLGLPVVLFRWLLAVELPQATPDGFLLPMSATSMLALGEIAAVLVLGFAVIARARTALAALPTSLPVDLAITAKPHA